MSAFDQTFVHYVYVIANVLYYMLVHYVYVITNEFYCMFSKQISALISFIHSCLCDDDFSRFLSFITCTSLM